MNSLVTGILVVKITCFGQLSGHFKQVGTLHQEVLHQAIDQGELAFCNPGIIVLDGGHVLGIFTLAQ